MGKGSEIYSIQICIRTKNVKYFCHEPSDGNPNLTPLPDRKKPPRPSQVSQSDLVLFRKDLCKSPLTGFFSKNLWQTYAQRQSDRDKTTDLGDPKPRQQPVPKWSAPDWWRQNRQGQSEITIPRRCLTPCCWFATSDRWIGQLYS